jgi:hypothetical protein
MFGWRCCPPRLSAGAVAFLPTSHVCLCLTSMPPLDLGYPANESVMNKSASVRRSRENLGSRGGLCYARFSLLILSDWYTRQRRYLNNMVGAG